MPISTRFLRFAPLLLAVPTVFAAIPSPPGSGSSDASRDGGADRAASVVELPTHENVRVLPSSAGGDVQQVVLGDMVVSLPADERYGDYAAADYAAADYEAADGEAAAAGAPRPGGFTTFSDTARLLRSGYVLRLTGADRRIEDYRPALAAAARAASSATGLPVNVAAAFGGSTEPGRGEIVVVVGDGPCGSGSAGCGGPALTSREVVSGRVWVAESSLGFGASMRANLAAHELGHALGLRHHDAAWTDGYQVMHPRLQGVETFRAGDVDGLRWMAGLYDRPAGAIEAVEYAAGAVHVEGTLRASGQVRLDAGTEIVDVASSGGRFVGSVPLPAGQHQVCALALDPGPGMLPELGCAAVDAPGRPFGHLDDPVETAAGVRIVGWAADPQTADPVQVEIRRDGVVVARVRADHQRSDLGTTANRYGDRHGFDVEVAAAVGTTQLCVVVVGVGDGGDLDLGCHEVHREPADLVRSATRSASAVSAPALTELGGVVDSLARPVVEVAGEISVGLAVGVLSGG